MTAPEVSEVLSINPNTVSSRLRLARRRCEALASSLGLGAALTVLLRDHCADLSPLPADLAEAGVTLAEPPPLSFTSTGGFAGASKVMVTLLVVAAASFATVLSLQISQDTTIARVQPPDLPRAAAPPNVERVPPSQYLALAPAPQASTEPRTIRRPVRVRSVHVSSGSMAPMAAASKGTPSLAAEHSILAAAEAALARGYTGEALQHLDEHRRDFPAGGSAETRDLLRVRAHCARGDVERARLVALERPRDPQFMAFAAKPCG